MWALKPHSPFDFSAGLALWGHVEFCCNLFGFFLILYQETKSQQWEKFLLVDRCVWRLTFTTWLWLWLKLSDFHYSSDLVGVFSFFIFSPADRRFHFGTPSLWWLSTNLGLWTNLWLWALQCTSPALEHVSPDDSETDDPVRQRQGHTDVEPQSVHLFIHKSGFTLSHNAPLNDKKYLTSLSYFAPPPPTPPPLSLSFCAVIWMCSDV